MSFVVATQGLNVAGSEKRVVYKASTADVLCLGSKLDAVPQAPREGP